jgi:plastocyanin
MGELFFFVGIALVIVAVAVSFLGLRDESFPASRGAMVGGLALFAVLVAVTAATAVVNARDEAEHRENEEAAEAAEEAELEQEAGQAEEAGEAGGGAAGAALELTSPEDGSLVFEPESLEAPAGEVTIAFTNPASIEHDVHIESDGEELAASELVADGDSSEASAELEPGEYAFYCAVPGHREGGMEGTLTVE